MTPHLWFVMSSSGHFGNVFMDVISVSCLERRAIGHFSCFGSRNKTPRNKRVLDSAPETKQEPFLGCVV